MRDYLRVIVWPLLVVSAACAEQATDVGAASEPLLADGPIETVTLQLTADTSIRSSQPNKNYGNAGTLDINRALVIVEPATLKAALPDSDFVESATLQFTLVPTTFPRLPRNLNAHRVLKAWTESGATWNCAVDSNTGNGSPNCTGATKWSAAGGEIASPPTGTTVIPSNRTGTVSLDVTADVRTFKNNALVNNYGWLLKTGAGNGGEVADLLSSESQNPPKLILKIRRCGGAEMCDDGNNCSQEFNFQCDDGVCRRQVAPIISDCSDNNPCTVEDHCSGMDFSCVAGTPAPAGTLCGEGGECDDAGNCSN